MNRAGDKVHRNEKKIRQTNIPLSGPNKLGQQDVYYNGTHAEHVFLADKIIGPERGGLHDHVTAAMLDGRNVFLHKNGIIIIIFITTCYSPGKHLHVVMVYTPNPWVDNLHVYTQR
jgi:hypothetical protein